MVRNLEIPCLDKTTSLSEEKIQKMMSVLECRITATYLPTWDSLAAIDHAMGSISYLYKSFLALSIESHKKCSSVLFFLPTQGRGHYASVFIAAKKEMIIFRKEQSGYGPHFQC